ncbi:hypothetical protein PVAP13_9NG847478 [Panicum virgatum]|uniref:Uncharacterized protein n=1 Tax=Panicum virgatum TaxID=38727 RepID=A0A8T0N1M3_PANVG|nr:hypothetical protein PVAP13_9NG847478 [Panicum virgatum]
MANFHRTGERWFGLGIRARDQTLIPSWEDGGMISGVAWRGARFGPCGTGARRRPWSVRRHGEKPGAGALPLPALRGFSSPSHGRAPPPPPSRSLALLPRWTWAGCRMCACVFFFPAAAGFVGQAEFVEPSMPLRAYGP